MQPSSLLKYLADPGTGLPVNLHVIETADGEPYNGILKTTDGRTVGILDRFKFRFVNYEKRKYLAARLAGASKETPHQPTSEIHGVRSERFSFHGDWLDVSDYLKVSNGVAEGAVATFRMETSCVDILLHKHEWSGICLILVNGKIIESCDLFNLQALIPFRIRINSHPGSVIEIRPSGMKNDQSLGFQVLVELIEEFSETAGPVVYKELAARNRGGEFSYRLFELIDQVPSEGLILDIGGGRRQLDDPRYLNLEFDGFDEVDIFADALRLPFKDNCIDLIYSDAVMEHVRDPLKMGDEIFRVLKPGGVALIGAAFMQPVHSEGQHFFNVTPYGIEEALRKLHKHRLWWDGNISHMVKWITRVAKVDNKIDEQDYLKFIEIAEKMDNELDYSDLMYVASGVWFEGSKHI